ncbi:MBL fold metallo-hydrolase [Paenibacillus sp. GXUN7292]|uniref:MBL fold metallo-hydrolase n=1 Tax=Paenibacillus sp. GXUN7292 TaxID=3422499 RepID=UPI003D7E713F
MTNELFVLSLSATVLGRTETVYPTLIVDEENVILVDTGYPGQYALLQAAVEETGTAFNCLNKLILTHQDLDHIGSLPDIHKQFGSQVEVMASVIEKPFIEGKQQLLKLNADAIQQAVASLPPQVPEQMREAFRKTLENPPRGAVNTIIAPDEHLAIGGGLVVIDSAGHTPGHISLYHNPSRTLIAGDALIVQEGMLLPPDPMLCIDPGLAKRSIENFLAYDIDSVVCYHGGVYTNQPNERLRELAERLR